MRYEFVGLAEKIKEASAGKKVYLYAPTGNWGDALIGYGTKSFLNHFHIPYEMLYINNELTDKLKWRYAGYSNRVLLVMGGGGWTSYYRFLPTTVELIQKKYRFKEIIILPSTYEKKYHVENCTFYKRDDSGSANHMPDAQFCHDLAFFVSRMNVPKSKVTKDVAYCFRQDGETSNAHAIPESNCDLSSLGTNLTGIYGFLDYLSEYSLVHTDRLHVAIGACLLGKEVHMYPGSYFKNKAIFDCSIRDYYDNVFFHDLFKGDEVA